MNQAVRTRKMKNTGVYFQYKTFAKTPDALSARHCHDEYEILYITAGNGRCVIEGAEYPIHPNTIIFAPPFCYHSINLVPDAAYERYVLQFSDFDLTQETQVFLKSLCDNLDGVGCYYGADAISPAIISLFERFEYGEALGEEEKKEFTRLLASELVLLLSVASRESIPRDEGELGARVIKYLNENIHKDICLDKLAKKFFVSKYYLCRAFKKHNGISVHGYVNQKRVMYAKRLIESGESASVAAYSVGFGDYSAFYRAYIKLIGRSPTAKEGKE